MLNSFKIKTGTNLQPGSVTPTIKGDLVSDSASGDLKYHNGTASLTNSN